MFIFSRKRNAHHSELLLLYNLQKIKSSRTARGETDTLTRYRESAGWYNHRGTLAIPNKTCVFTLWPSSSQLGSHRQETPTPICTCICTRLLTAALLAMTKLCKQPQCQHTGNWLPKKTKNKTKPCYSHTTEDYAGVEKGEEGLYELMEWFLGCMDKWRS